MLVLGLTGCRIQSTLIMTSLAPYAYATPGQTLEWLPSSPQATPIYVDLGVNSPCPKQYYLVGPKPARCKVLKDHNGYFAYHFETQEPDPKGLYARSCPYCQVAIEPPSQTPAVVATKGDSDDSGTGYSLNVSCKSGVATVDSSPVRGGVQDQDQVSWVPIYPAHQVTVTTNNNMCTGGDKGVFNANQVCTVSGPPSSPGQPPVPYTYDVKLDQCAGPGSGNLTINPPPPPPPPAQ